MRQRTLAQARGALAALTTPSSSPKQARGALAAGSVALWEVEASAGEGWRAPAAVRQIEQVSSS